MNNKHPIAVWREASALSQDEAASRFDVTRWTVNSIETGRRKPSVALVRRIEAITGIPRETLRPDIFKQGADA